LFRFGSGTAKMTKIRGEFLNIQSFEGLAFFSHG